MFAGISNHELMQTYLMLLFPLVLLGMEVDDGSLLPDCREPSFNRTSASAALGVS